VNVIPSPGREIPNSRPAFSTEKRRPYGCILNNILFLVVLDSSCTRMVYDAWLFYSKNRALMGLYFVTCSADMCNELLSRTPNENG
jgi:hypothetical protein